MHLFKQLTQILTLVGALAVTGLTCFPAQAQNKGDEALLEMAQAFRKNDKARLSALLPQARGHVLEPLAAYWELRPRLDTASESEIRNFLTTYAGTYYEDRLRTDWLLQLGRRRDWATFTAVYPYYRMRDDREVRCYALVTEAINSKANVTEEAKRLWYSLREAEDGCTYVAEHLHSGKQINGVDLWRKARIAMDANRPAPAKAAVDIEAPRLSEQVALIHADPAKYLDKRIIAITRNRKELAVLALIRLAASDPDKAAQLLDHRWEIQLSAEERNWTWAVIGKQAAQKLQDNASSYFANVRKDSDLNDDLLGWKVRAALRMGQWKQVLSATQAMSPEARKDPTWTYWQARALLATAGNDTAQKQEAQNLLRSIASVRGFYEQLALEELGQSITVPDRPVALTAPEKSQAQANPGLQRALYAIGIGLRAEGNREWNYSTNLHTPGGMNDRELLAAADLACQRQVWDRCINTSDRTKEAIDFDQRFPMPLRDIVVRRAGEIKLDPAYVYGLIRQESRFIMDARSHVGASGLMQVMPATAKWTAKKIGLTSFTPDQITDKEVNVAIGTGYLKLVLDDFEGSMALAAAAYNAGPSRSRNWRNGPVLEAAIWAENVPFQETRDYVKKVLSNTTNYAAILTRQPQSLKSRLGQVGPRNKALVEVNTDLP
ncbi:lytic transglycosylase domain-containing protein [Limnohabitans lacus]|uniref:Transglycosylase SLT domain-containing protein n=1 Tax=Limnohabitans lacus TaxID=3045173 RepID=A0ABT6X704_9BURK|nr:lytic transglycosylase domain-containing protein [Limnohabitans sp. HM2-2]MDI9233903.1 transglycosylase SLT domain-containing protein [Limnohabitans sp. HM2-2]